jgi:hypothetical protein
MLGYLILAIVAIFGFRLAFKKKNLRYCKATFKRVGGTSRQETVKLPINNDQIEFQGGKYTCATEAEEILDGLPHYTFIWRNPIPIITKPEVSKGELDAISAKHTETIKSSNLAALASRYKEATEGRRGFIQFLAILAAALFSLGSIFVGFQLLNKMDEISTLLNLIKVKL